jgi:hypothetical protein
MWKKCGIGGLFVAVCLAVMITKAPSQDATERKLKTGEAKLDKKETVTLSETTAAPASPATGSLEPTPPIPTATPPKSESFVAPLPMPATSPAGPPAVYSPGQPVVPAAPAPLTTVIGPATLPAVPCLPAQPRTTIGPAAPPQPATCAPDQPAKPDYVTERLNRLMQIKQQRAALLKEEKEIVEEIKSHIQAERQKLDAAEQKLQKAAPRRFEKSADPYSRSSPVLPATPKSEVGPVSPLQPN